MTPPWAAICSIEAPAPIVADGGRRQRRAAAGGVPPGWVVRHLPASCAATVGDGTEVRAPAGDEPAARYDSGRRHVRSSRPPSASERPLVGVIAVLLAMSTASAAVVDRGAAADRRHPGRARCRRAPRRRSGRRSGSGGRRCGARAGRSVRIGERRSGRPGAARSCSASRCGGGPGRRRVPLRGRDHGRTAETTVQEEQREIAVICGRPHLRNRRGVGPPGGGEPGVDDRLVPGRCIRAVDADRIRCRHRP